MTVDELVLALVAELASIPMELRVRHLTAVRAALRNVSPAGAPTENALARPQSCYACGHRAEAVGPPAGWLALSMRNPDGYAKLGIYCSPQCLEDSMRRIRRRIEQQRASIERA